MLRDVMILAMFAALFPMFSTNNADAGALHDAAISGDVGAIKQLLSEGVDVDDKRIATPLFFAA